MVKELKILLPYFDGISSFGRLYFISWIFGIYTRLEYKKTDLIKKNAIEVSSSEINRNNDGKLISINGSIHSNETLQDLYVTIHNALALKRKVEMYQ